MSWGFRRRIKVLPGVHLNVGKRGVSTSFGRRGASITFGKRGTFLNLGIPGTGLYSRQKIGGGYSMSAGGNDVPISNDDTAQDGCLKTGILFLTRAALVVVAFLILVENVVWGIGFSVVAIIIALVVNSCFNKKVSEDQPDPVTETVPQESVSTPKEEPQLPVPQEYFNNIVPDVEKIIDFYQTLCNDSNFMKILSDGNVIMKVVNNGKTSGLADQLKAAFWVDMTKCMIDLGYELNLKHTNNFGLFYFLLRTNGLSRFEYDNLFVVCNEETYQTCTDFAMQLKQSIEANSFTISERLFLVPTLLNQYDSNLSRQYLVMMYRYASFVAKADGTVDEKESTWLSEILNQSQDSGQLDEQVKRRYDDAPKVKSKSATATKVEKLTTLDSLIGLAPVKEDISTLTNFIKIQKEREAKGMKTTPVSCHCVFTGNPGTGKTTVARILAGIYKNLGVVTQGQLIETDRSGLVAEYVGQTAVKTNKIIDTALDGVLFIDEAYSLISKGENDYGKEAIATLLKRMEDDRDRLIVILAGYTDEMKEFIDSNPGLQSRFNRYIEFPDYSADELLQIFESNLKKSDYKMADDAAIALKDYLVKAVAQKDKNFGNARFVRNLFEKTIERQANRLANEPNLTNEKLSLICTVDLPLSL